MSRIEWTEEYSVAVEEVDLQHKQLFRYLDQLAESIETGRGDIAVGTLLNELISYVNVHFKLEEEYFERYSYPQADEHRILHGNFVLRVNWLMSRYAAGETSTAAEMLTFLQDWICEHILYEDKKYAPYLTAEIFQS